MARTSPMGKPETAMSCCTGRSSSESTEAPVSVRNPTTQRGDVNIILRSEKSGELCCTAIARQVSSYGRTIKVA